MRTVQQKLCAQYSSTSFLGRASLSRSRKATARNIPRGEA
jgi:hypothetical protein